MAAPMCFVYIFGDFQLCLFGALFLIKLMIIKVKSEHQVEEDLLLPYTGLHGPTHGHRFVRECQPDKYGNVTHSMYAAHSNYHQSSDPRLQVHSFSIEIGDWYNKRVVSGHEVIVNNPSLSVSVLEPQKIDGCQDNTVETVAASAMQKNCIFAINAGYFNVTSGTCLGNVVSDGRLVQNSGGVQNAHFGITKDAQLYFGYLSERQVLEETFQQLVGGVLWLVRDGENYVDVSKRAECSDAESTGTLQSFIDVISARSAVGHDREGRVVLVHVDGKSWNRGVNLYEFADLLISRGVVNAINLDGGGSSTAVLNGTVINYPSDTVNVDNRTYNVARNVSTVLCVHDVSCNPVDCNHHGNCVHGSCHCQDNWHGDRCDVLLCGRQNCSSHGNCTDKGCVCTPGFYGVECQDTCASGQYGPGCSLQCRCAPGVTCDAVDGHCLCAAGFTGYYCENRCPLGFYGEGCQGVCECTDHCYCHHVTGSCYHGDDPHWQVGQCLGHLTIVDRQDTLALSRDDFRLWLFVVLLLAVIATCSVLLNILLLHKCLTRKTKKSRHSSATSQIGKLPTFEPLYDSSQELENTVLDTKVDDAPGKNDQFEVMAMQRLKTSAKTKTRLKLGTSNA